MFSTYDVIFRCQDCYARPKRDGSSVSWTFTDGPGFTMFKDVLDARPLRELNIREINDAVVYKVLYNTIVNRYRAKPKASEMLYASVWLTRQPCGITKDCKGEVGEILQDMILDIMVNRL